MKFEYINGQNFYYMFLAGAKGIIENYAYLNKINVFPVPDGDTGSNMASTVQSIIDAVKPSKKLNKTLADMADAALVGARGNSGIIVAQFVQGLSLELQKYSKVNVRDFVRCAAGAVRFTYAALSHPVEGTILSVLKAWTDELQRLMDGNTTDFVTLISAPYQKVLEAVEATRNRHKGGAGLVDAGAQGFAFFAKGMLDFALHADMKGLVGARQNVLPELNVADDEDAVMTFRYCTEALASGENIDKEALKHDLEGLGDSVVVAGNSNKVRIHVHTDTPETAVRKLSERAHILTSKVDDMAFQVEIKAHRRHDIAVVVDSASDLDAALRFKHQIHHVPLQVQLGDSLFLDGVTLKHDDFYDYLASKQPYPKTSLPALKNIYNKLSYIATYYKAIIVLNISSGVSGTHQAFVDMAKKVQMQTGVPIAVFDTKTLASAQGLVALRVTEALDKGFSFEDLKRLIPLWCAQSNLYAMTKTIRYFVKGGRIGRMKGWLATFLGLAPVVTPDRNGKGSVLFTAASQGKGVERVLKIVENKLKTGRLHAYAVEYTDQSAKPVAEALIPRLKALTGKEPAFIGQVTPVVGSSAGIGTVALSTLME